MQCNKNKRVKLIKRKEMICHSIYSQTNIVIAAFFFFFIFLLFLILTHLAISKAQGHLYVSMSKSANVLCVYIRTFTMPLVPQRVESQRQNIEGKIIVVREQIEGLQIIYI